MRQRASGTMARSAVSLCLIAVPALAIGAGLLGATQTAEAGTTPTVPGAPTYVTARAERAQAQVNWSAPTSDGGAPITTYKIRATDLTDGARGGQRANSKYPGYVGQRVLGLTAGDKYTFTVSATNSVGTGPASAPSNTVIPTPPPPPAGISCEHVIGTTSGVVALSSCNTGTGTLPGATLKGTTTGKMDWKQGTKSYSTAIAVTTTLIPNSLTSGYCARQRLGGAYLVHGKVTANTNPRTAVGASVTAYLCISASGVVRQDHYGSFAF